MNYPLELIILCKHIIEISNNYNINTNAKQYKELIFNVTSSFLPETTLSKRVISISKDSLCECVICKSKILDPNKKYCSHKCKGLGFKKFTSSEQQRGIKLNNQIEQSLIDYKDGIEYEDYVECKICGYRAKQLSGHIKHIHSKNLKEYRIQFNVSRTMINSLGQQSGELNVAFNHGGKLSPFSKKFIKYENLNAVEVEEKLKEIVERSTETTISNNNLNSKSDDERDEINKRKMSASGSISKGEKDLYLELINLGYDLESQFTIKNSINKTFIYDMKFKNKIIEFNGDFWHSNPKLYSEDFINPYNKLSSSEIWKRDEIKIQCANDNGFEVLIIWENDFKKYKEDVINKCCDFLNGVDHE